MKQKYLLCISFQLLICSIIFGQSSQLTFKDSNLEEIIKTIEKKSSISYNYDPGLVAGIKFTGTIDVSKPEQTIQRLLYDTPLAGEKVGDQWLISMPPPKEYLICGYLKQNIDGSPLPFANISMLNYSEGSQSDDNGYFEFTTKAHKNDRIAISYLGYETQSIMIQEWRVGSCPSVNMKEDTNMMLSEITVTDYILRGIEEGQEYNGVHVDFPSLSQNYAAHEHDVLKTIQLLPGINSIDESVTKLNIRGSAPDHNLILWEGATLYDPGHFFGMISSVNPFVIDQVKIHKGVFDPKYDSRIGGIVDMSLNEKIPTALHGGAGSNMTEAHAYLHLPTASQKFSVQLSGRRSVQELFQSPTLLSYADKVFQATKVEENETTTQDTRESFNLLKYYDINAKIQFHLGDKVKVKSSLFNSSNRFSFDSFFTEEEINSSDRINFETFALSNELSIKWNNDHQSRVYLIDSHYNNEHTYALSNDFDSEEETEEDEEESDDEDLVFLRNTSYNDINDQQIGLNHNWIVNTSAVLDFGYVLDRKEVNYQIQQFSTFQGDASFEEFAKGTFHNIYGSFKWQKKGWSIDIGNRSTYYLDADRILHAPRISAQYQWNKNLKLKASAGSLYQFISQVYNVGDTDLNINNNIWILTENENGQILNAKKYAIGAVYRQNGWLVDLEAYHNLTEELSTLNTDLSNINVDSDGASLTKGIDLLINKKWDRYQYWINYSLSKSEFFLDARNDMRIPSPTHQLHRLSIINQYQFQQWNLALTYQFRSGLPYSQPSGIQENVNPDTGGILYETTFDNINNFRLPNYSRLDISVGYRPALFDKKYRVEINASFLNVLGRENLFSRNYVLKEGAEISGPPEVLTIDKRMLGFTPQLLVRVHF